jgi:hypothetical protein
MWAVSEKMLECVLRSPSSTWIVLPEVRQWHWLGKTG